MTDQELLDLFLKISGDDRNLAEDAALLKRLAQLARQDPTEPDSDLLSSGMMNDCLYAIAHSTTLFPTALSIWLSSDEDARLGIALQHQASVAHLSQSHPQPYDLIGVDEQQVVTAALRLCALNAAPAVSLGWTLSLARQFPASSTVGAALTTLLDYHSSELPGSTHTLLTSNESVFRALDASITTLEGLNRQNEELDALPHLREFEMAADMRLMLSTLKRNEQRDIHRGAEEQSIFRLIAKKIRFKYGGEKPVVELKGPAGTTDTAIDMVSQELSVELPLSEATDPVLGNSRRNRLWAGKLA
jgi:hypothetical protein